MVNSLYLHIPFCVSKCLYCSFSSYPGMEAMHERYSEALCTELATVAELAKQDNVLQTIFFGGGTPTVLSASRIADILNRCRTYFTVSEYAEISIEANPGTISYDDLRILRDSGVNRLSIGVQSFSDSELLKLGRMHSADEAIEVVAAARNAGFSNISIDLMYGLPGQTVSSWRRSLEKALELSPDHLSMYQLTVEEGTPFYAMEESGELVLPDEDTVIAIDELNRELCSQAGFTLYEISNYAKAGCRCQHNINYWENNEYLAAGAGAVSYVEGERCRRIEDPVQYCNMIESGNIDQIIVEREKLATEESFRETIMIGLRMTEGVNLQRVLYRFQIDPVLYYGKKLTMFIDEGLLEITATHLRFTDSGRLLANSILSELV